MTEEKSVDQIREEFGSSADIRKDSQWKRIMQWAILVTVVCLVAGVAVLAVRDYYRGEAIDKLAGALDNTAQQVETCQTQPDSAACLVPTPPSASQVIEEVPGPVGPVGPMGPEGPQGEEGPPPSDAQVQAALDVYCSTGRCDGQNPSRRQIVAAVSIYCDANGQCVGEDGEDGQDGAQGPRGEQGPAPTASQVAAALTSYCEARNNCQGDTGARGERGAPGETGPAGPACPDGYTSQMVTVETGDNPTNTDTRDIYACVPN